MLEKVACFQTKLRSLQPSWKLWCESELLQVFLSNVNSARASFHFVMPVSGRGAGSWDFHVTVYDSPSDFPCAFACFHIQLRKSGVASKRPFAREARQWRLHFQRENETGWGMWPHMIYVGTRLSASQRRGQSWVSWGRVNTIKLSTQRIRNDVTSVRRQSGTYFKPFHDSRERRTLVASTAQCSLFHGALGDDGILI